MMNLEKKNSHHRKIQKKEILFMKLLMRMNNKRLFRIEDFLKKYQKL